MVSNGDAGKVESAPDGSDRYKLAYEAAMHSLSQQDGTLGNLRNRATGLVTIATVIASFAGFFGVGTKDKPLPAEYAVGLVIFIVLIVAAVMYVLMPKKDWAFGPDAKDILDSEYGGSELLWSQALGMHDSVADNDKEINRRAKAYSVAVVLLGLEAVYTVIVSLVSR
ncbi:hypothetical protein ACGFYQ_01320 [Streptomyces sp. NPDC048258]|uniref:hypothetical protein n=1 Tax=Streptomyces sp. NPDC048258 TaxID=3365527 RepID=UPI003710BD6F